MSTLPKAILRLHYDKALDEYVRNLTDEDLMESLPQATQRKITLASLELVHAQRPEVQIFNELMIQYPIEGEDRPSQVVPDNMVVVHDEPIEADGSFALPFQPVGPLVVLEYVSRSSRRKDYEISYEKYEQAVGVPYFLLFDPDALELILFHLEEGLYRAVPPNSEGRHPIPELDLEVAMLDNWVRYWYRGELLPLPGDLLADLRETRQRLREQTHRADQASQEAEEQTRRADQAAQEAEEQRRVAEEERRVAEEERRVAEEERRVAEEERRRADGAERKANEVEKQLAEMKEELERLRRGHS